MLADRIGSLEPGKDADLVLMDGPPFDLHAERVEKVFVEGVLQYERKELRQKESLTSVGPFKPLKAALRIDAPSFALSNATVFTVSHGVLKNATMIVKDGKIAQLEAGAQPPKGMTVIDLGGRVVSPGWVTSRVFPNDWTGDLKFQVQNNEELEPIVPEMRVRFSVDPWFPSYEANREIGLTTEHITPGLLNLVGGTGIMAKMRTLDLDVMIRKDPTCMVMSFTSEPLRQFGRNSQIPVTLATAIQMIRASLDRARAYLAKPQDPKTFDLRLEAYRPVLTGKIPVVMHANSVDEIHEALKLAAEYKLKPIISGGSEAWKVADELARANVPVILGDSATNMEGVRGAGRRAGFNDQSPLILSRAGVKVGFFGFSGARRGQPTGRLGGEPALNAMWAFRNGVPEDQAMRMVTLNPAEMFGTSDLVGSLDVGKDADFMILEGNPLDYRVLPQVVVIDGEMVHPKRAPRAKETTQTDSSS
jgi:imidazolonepropionase-like amidohydrolase